MRAAEKGSVEVVERLLHEGEDPNQADDFGLTALHGSAKKGHTHIVALLVSRGADVNACDVGWRGEAPLHYACKYGHADVARVLLCGGADPHFGSKSGKTPLQYAEEKQYSHIVDLFSSTTAMTPGRWMAGPQP